MPLVRLVTECCYLIKLSSVMFFVLVKSHNLLNFSMMRSIATTAAGVAGGHLAANAIMGMVSGGKSDEPAPAPGI